MAVIRTEKVIEVLTSNDTNAVSRLASEIIGAGEGGRYGYDPVVRARYDRESAIAMYQQLREYTAAHGYFQGKLLRPWAHDEDVLGKLDRSEPWWGWEFETGYPTAQQRTDVINHVWDTWDGVTFDAEGEGNYSSEITFVPAERSKYYDGSAPAIQFMKYISENKLGQNSGETNIGTHLNLSLPEFGTDVNVVHLVSHALQASVAALPRINEEGEDIRKLMFGRARLYGGFFSHNNYIEGKLFRTTYDINQFVTYIRTAEVLTRAAAAITNKVLEIYKKTPPHQISYQRFATDIGQINFVVVTNLWQMFTGEEIEPNVKHVMIRSPFNRISFDPNSGFTFRNYNEDVGYQGDIIGGGNINEQFLNYVDIVQPIQAAQRAA